LSSRAPAFDFQFDQTADGRALKLLNIADEFTREALVILVERSIDADSVGETGAADHRAWCAAVAEVRQRAGDDSARAL